MPEPVGAGAGWSRGRKARPAHPALLSLALRSFLWFAHTRLACPALQSQTRAFVTQVRPLQQQDAGGAAPACPAGCPCPRTSAQQRPEVCFLTDSALPPEVLSPLSPRTEGPERDGITERGGRAAGPWTRRQGRARPVLGGWPSKSSDAGRGLPPG